MVGNLPKRCERCNATVTHGNMKRHNSRHHPEQLFSLFPEATAAGLELRDTLSGVLERCDIPEEVWPARRGVLDRLQNYRHLEHRTTVFDLLGGCTPQIVNDTLVGEALPPFEELIVQLAAVVGHARAEDERLSDDLIVRVVIA